MWTAVTAVVWVEGSSAGADPSGRQSVAAPPGVSSTRPRVAKPSWVMPTGPVTLSAIHSGCTIRAAARPSCTGLTRRPQALR